MRIDKKFLENLTKLEIENEIWNITNSIISYEKKVFVYKTYIKRRKNYLGYERDVKERSKWMRQDKKTIKHWKKQLKALNIIYKEKK